MKGKEFDDAVKKLISRTENIPPDILAVSIFRKDRYIDKRRLLNFN